MLVCKREKTVSTSAYLLPVDPVAPKGEWLGEKLSCRKYYTKEATATEITQRLFYEVKWEKQNLAEWKFTMGVVSWVEILRRVKLLWPHVPAAGVSLAINKK